MKIELFVVFTALRKAQSRAEQRQRRGVLHRHAHIALLRLISEYRGIER